MKDLDIWCTSLVIVRLGASKNLNEGAIFSSYVFKFEAPNALQVTGSHGSVADSLFITAQQTG